MLHFSLSRCGHIQSVLMKDIGHRPGLFWASIAGLHVTAPSFSATNWPIIAQLYAKLMHLTHNPFVNVNRAIALYYSGGQDEAFAILEELHRHPFFNQYFPLTSALGKLHALAGRSQLASKFLNMALTQTKLAAEKRFILQIASRFQIELS